jgi:hypothetical protein
MPDILLKPMNNANLFAHPRLVYGMILAFIECARNNGFGVSINCEAKALSQQVVGIAVDEKQLDDVGVGV